MLSREQILLNNLEEVKKSLESACKRTGRDPLEVTLLAVTKYAKDSDVLTLLKTGQITDIGESRLQQAWARWKENPDFAKYSAVRKHFIGHLQKNKAAKAAQLFDFIDSVDSPETAEILAQHVPAGKQLRLLVQVKLSDKATQSGLPLKEARALAEALKKLPGVRVCGYMGIAPQGAPIPVLQNLFRTLYRAYEEDFPASEERYLSLGMSEDFETAVEEGSSLPRIGSRLFTKNLEEV